MPSFSNLSRKVSRKTGTLPAILIALIIVVIWAYSQILGLSWAATVINVITAGTFLLTMLIKKDQNIKDRAVHAKLDNILEVLNGTDEELKNIEEKADSEEEVEETKNNS